MAALGRLSVKLTQKSPKLCNAHRSYGSFRHSKAFINLRTSCVCAVTGGLVIFAAAKWKENSTVHALRRAKDEALQQATKLTARERRFIRFASTEFDNQLYMTPQDFLDSVVEQDPRPRLKRRQLTLNEVQALKSSTPPLKKGSHQMFRNLREKGIISYTEYLFLLSILTKPQSGFQIAFNMFDTDGNQRVDKMEFLVIRRLLGGSMEDRELNDATRKALLSLVSTKEMAAFIVKPKGKKNLEDIKAEEHKEHQEPPPTINRPLMERIFSYAYRGRRGLDAGAKDGSKATPESPLDELIDDEQGLQRKHKVDTTLQIHFFGKNGKDDLRYEGFRKFMENLQYEVLELEYQEYAKGHETITEVDFAQILLRYTQLDGDVYDMYLERLLDRVKDQHKGISFQEFKDFCEFLNNLEDFAMAMKMYTLADHPISKDEFFRAVKICTGNVLTKHVVNTVFAIFDNDGDGLLSYQEFVAIMKDRLHRGFKSSARNEGWDAFKSCLKNEMKKTV